MSNYTIDKIWIDDDQNGLPNDMPNGRHGRRKSILIKIKAGVPSVKTDQNEWRPLQPEDEGFCPPGYDCTNLTEDDFAYFKGGRWVYINGRWYYIR